MVGVSLYCSAYEEKIQEEIRNLLEKEAELPDEKITEQESTALETTHKQAVPSEILSQELPLEILPEFRKLYEQNNDMVGWLFIEGTKLNYPVMSGIDNEYYLKHDFYGEESKYGCLFVKSGVDVNAQKTNFVVYGHRMKDGAMFGQLKKYMEEKFFLQHPSIIFSTLYEKREYEIIAVFLSQVYDENEEAFKYYEFYQADNEQEFYYFYDNIKQLSLYDTGITAEYGDRFITLSTCAYHVKDGRLVVVAKEIIDN